MALSLILSLSLSLSRALSLVLDRLLAALSLTLSRALSLSLALSLVLDVLLVAQGQDPPPPDARKESVPRGLRSGSLALDVLLVAQDREAVLLALRAFSRAEHVRVLPRLPKKWGTCEKYIVNGKTKAGNIVRL